MANIFSPITDEWTVVDTSPDAVRRITALIGAVVFSVILGLFLGSVFLAFGTSDATAGRDLAHEFGGFPPRFTRPDDTLIVWAVDQAHVSPDFIAVIDFNQHSPTYGKVLSTVPLTGASAFGNEPHHGWLSADGKTLALDGLLSVLRNQDQVFFFDVSRPREPSFIRSDNPPHASIADEFDSLRNGGFLATFMGSPDGVNPGRLVEYDANQHFVQAWPLNPRSDGFDPHGISIDEAHNLIVTSDFICPLHTLNVTPGAGEVILRGSVRVWNLATRSIVRKIVVDNPASPAGTIGVQLIPGDRQLRAYTAGMADNKLYLIDTLHGTATPVFDFSPFAVAGSPIWPQLFKLNHAGTPLFITLNYSGNAGKVVQLDVSNPQRPRNLGRSIGSCGSGNDAGDLGTDRRRVDRGAGDGLDAGMSQRIDPGRRAVDVRDGS
jgi:56kDa selenium binding protein (SBP56)